MIEDELEKKSEDYPDRHKLWTQHQLSQFGFSINLFTTIGIGFLGYLIYNHTEYPVLSFGKNSSFSWELFLYMFAILSISFSIWFGILSNLYRLYDLRLTRHLFSIIRQYSGIEKTDLVKFLEKRIDPKMPIFRAFCQILCKKIFVEKSDFKCYKTIKEKFKKIRKLSIVISRKSWIFHKRQIGLFVIAALVFGALILFVK